MPAAASGLDPYEILGVSRDASAADIRKAYQGLALQLHPDKRTSAGTAEPSDPGTTFQQLQNAWETLRDDSSRAAYVSLRCPGADDCPPHVWASPTLFVRVPECRTKATGSESKLRRHT